MESLYSTNCLHAENDQEGSGINNISTQEQQLSNTDQDQIDKGTINEYFTNISRAHWSLLVYLTTANSPDIMTQSYEQNRFYFLFFWAYFLVAHYLILKVLIALLAAKFVSYFKESVQRSYQYRIINLRHAFHIMSENVQTVSIVKKAAVEELFKKLDLSNDTVDKLLEQSSGLPNNAHRTDLEWSTFKHIFLQLFQNASKIEKTNNASRQNDKWFILLLIDFYSGLIATIHVITLTILLVQFDQDSKSDNFQHSLSLTTFVFSFLFAFEAMIKILNRNYAGCALMSFYLVFGCTCIAWDDCKRVRNKLFRLTVISIKIIDEVILLSVIVIGLLHSPCITNKNSNFCVCKQGSGFIVLQVTNVLVLLRLIGLVVTSDIFSNITHTLIHVIVLLIPIGLLSYIFYFVFAVTGIYLYEFEFQKLSSKDIMECQIYNYHAYNFQDYASALVTLWNLMIVNNWHIIAECYSGLTSELSRVFFITWWILSEMIINGVVFGTLLYIIEQAIAHDKNTDNDTISNTNSISNTTIISTDIRINDNSIITTTKTTTPIMNCPPTAYPATTNGTNNIMTTTTNNNDGTNTITTTTTTTTTTNIINTNTTTNASTNTDVENAIVTTVVTKTVTTLIIEPTASSNHIAIPTITLIMADDNSYNTSSTTITTTTTNDDENITTITTLTTTKIASNNTNSATGTIDYNDNTRTVTNTVTSTKSNAITPNNNGAWGTLEKILQGTGLINNEQNKYGFKSRINTWSIFYVRDFDEIDASKIEKSIDEKWYNHPDIQQPTDNDDDSLWQHCNCVNYHCTCITMIKMALILVVLILIILFVFILTDFPLVL